MKKIFTMLLILVTGCLCCLGGSRFYAFATEPQDKTYLIEASYQQNAGVHGILNEEIKTTSRPFDFSTEQMMLGQSVMPAVSNTTSKEFSKTLTINNVPVSQSQSLYIYLFFSEELANNLTITLLDDSSNSACWQLDKDLLISQITNIATNSKLRFGWQLVELPLQKATISGTITAATKLKLDYFTTNVNNQYKYARLSFYAPYVSTQKNSDITFSDKQNFYNFKVNYGDNFNSYCAGDMFAVSRWSDLFDYCIIGDIDCLQYQTNLYQFKLQIIDQNNSIIEASMFNAGEFSVGLVNPGYYTFRVTLYDNVGNWLWKAPDQYTLVSEFVAVYLANGIADMKEGATSNFKIYTGEFVKNSANLTATSSDTSIAEVRVENGELVVDAKKAGKATITLSVDASREHASEQTYTYEYTITVKAVEKPVSWLGIILGFIGLIIASVIVYIIMVKRRLIAGRYPKY